MLDTNVISELTRARPSPAVMSWAHGQPREAIFTTAVCEAELLSGLAVIQDGRRRATLSRAIESMLDTVLSGKILPFDRAAARIYADLAARSRAVGRPVGVADLQIAAIAVARNADAIATRSTAHFADCGIRVIDPWATAPDRS